MFSRLKNYSLLHIRVNCFLTFQKYMILVVSFLSHSVIFSIEGSNGYAFRLSFHQLNGASSIPNLFKPMQTTAKQKSLDVPAA